MKDQKPKTSIVNILVLLILGLFILNLYIPRRCCRGANITALKAGCMNNLKQIGKGIEVYASDMHFGAEAFAGSDKPIHELLYAGGEGVVPDKKSFRCPLSNYDYDYDKTFHSDYGFFPLGKLKSMDELKPDMIIACDKPENHGGIDWNFLYANGNVKRKTGVTLEVYKKWYAAFVAGDLSAAELGPVKWNAQGEGM